MDQMIRVDTVPNIEYPKVPFSYVGVWVRLPPGAKVGDELPAPPGVFKRYVGQGVDGKPCGAIDLIPDEGT